MASLIQKIAVQFSKTFVKYPSKHPVDPINLTELYDLTNRLTAEDLNFDAKLLSDFKPFAHPQSPSRAPVTCINMWDDRSITMSIFVVRNGCRLPLHDHPGMHGIIKVIHGTIKVKSYSLVQDDAVHFTKMRTSFVERFQKPVLLVREHISNDIMDVNSSAIYLTPNEGNYHELTAVEGPAVFFDMLSPSYEVERGTRPCHYYREFPMPSDTVLGSSRDTENLRLLTAIPPPRDYWSNSALYNGPSVNPYDHESADNI